MEMEGSVADLVKAGAFVIVQALVYLILSSSSAFFSRPAGGQAGARSTEFLRSPSQSLRRFLAELSDLPSAGELSPRPCFDAKEPKLWARLSD